VPQSTWKRPAPVSIGKGGPRCCSSRMSFNRNLTGAARSRAVAKAWRQVEGPAPTRRTAPAAQGGDGHR
jgi:hypothetical protein